MSTEPSKQRIGLDKFCVSEVEDPDLLVVSASNQEVDEFLSDSTRKRHHSADKVILEQARAKLARILRHGKQAIKHVDPVTSLGGPIRGFPAQ